MAPIILPDMYRIFLDHETYGIRTRSRAIEIFTTLTSMVCTIGEVNRGLSKSLLGPILPTFTEALVSGLSLPDNSHASDPGLKSEILKARPFHPFHMLIMCDDDNSYFFFPA